jgi:hypothetical protein
MRTWAWFKGLSHLLGFLLGFVLVAPACCQDHQSRLYSLRHQIDTYYADTDYMGEERFPSRQLTALSQYDDPQDVMYKEEQSILFGHEQRPLQFLFLGGSNTYGARIDNHFDAYPYRLDLPGYVDVAALNATGTWFYSLCLESLIERDFRGSTRAINLKPEDIDSTVILSEKNYDIIVLEFAVNGFENLELLIKRLRQRYPHAVIILFELWTLASMLAVSGEADKKNVFAKTLRDADPTDLVWNDKCSEAGCGRAHAEKIASAYGGFIYRLPRTFATPADAVASGWYTEDWNHLTSRGHRAVANRLSSYLQRKEGLVRMSYRENKRFGDYGLGDQCYNWHHNGGNVSPEVQHTGFELNHLDRNDASWKHVLSLVEPIGTIVIQSHFDIPVPLAMVYLTQSEGDSFPEIEVSVNNQPSARVDPNHTDSRMKFKMLRHSQIGFAVPGTNVIQFRQTGTTPIDQFSISGIILCGVCVGNGNNLGEGHTPVEIFPLQ